MNDLDFDPFRVRLLRMHNPLVKAALAAYAWRTSPKIPFAIGEASFGGIRARK